MITLLIFKIALSLSVFEQDYAKIHWPAEVVFFRDKMCYCICILVCWTEKKQPLELLIGYGFKRYKEYDFFIILSLYSSYLHCTILRSFSPMASKIMLFYHTFLIILFSYVNCTALCKKNSRNYLVIFALIDVCFTLSRLSLVDITGNISRHCPVMVCKHCCAPHSLIPFRHAWNI